MEIYYFKRRLIIKNLYNLIFEFLSNNKVEMIVFSVVVLVLSVAVCIWWVLSRPSDYFIKDDDLKNRSLIIEVYRWILSLFIILFGGVLMIAPGPGILFILIGIAINPSKLSRKIMNKILVNKEVKSTLNLIRQRFGKEQFIFS